MKRKYGSLDESMRAQDDYDVKQLIGVYNIVEISRDPVEGHCPDGQPCPTGICREQSHR